MLKTMLKVFHQRFHCTSPPPPLMKVFHQRFHCTPPAPPLMKVFHQRFHCTPPPLIKVFRGFTTTTTTTTMATTTTTITKLLRYSPATDHIEENLILVIQWHVDPFLFLDQQSIAIENQLDCVHLALAILYAQDATLTLKPHP